jgi:hypothetical protein
MDELRKRQYRPTNSDLKWAQRKSDYNKRMGAMIRERIKWVMKRQSLKL